jgi:hypothetical protein
MELYEVRDEERESLDYSIDTTKSKRGKKAIPIQWSSVISFSKDNVSDLKAFDLVSGMLISKAVTESLTRIKVG